MEIASNDSEEILQELNQQEVLRHVPLLIFLSAFCMAGCFGNSLVLYVYKTKYSSSNCRTFVLFLSAVDMFSAGIVIPIEILVLTREYIFRYENICKLSVFLNTWPTLTSGFLLLAIAIDRYRKVCKPFNWQVSHNAARIMCFLTALIGVAFSWISPVIYGVQERQHEKYRVIVSECVETNAWKKTVFPLINSVSFALLFLGALTGIIVMYCFIAVHVQRHVKKKAALGGKRGTYAVEPREASELTIMSGKVVVKRLDKVHHARKYKQDTESSDDMFCSSHLADANLIKAGGEGSEPENSSFVVCSIDDHIELEDTNQRKSMLSRMLSFGRSSLALTKSLSIASNKTSINLNRKGENPRQLKKHRTAFIMFLISLGFIVSYLPLLCILLIRTIDSTFVSSLSDEGRTAYKFFLRSYYLNCAINPVIYGLWDSRFRKHTKQLLCRK